MSPIKPENKHRYPADWPERRAFVLERAGLRCELCGAPNGRYIFRQKGCTAIWKTGPYHPVVVLNVAHLDPTYSSHDPKHLLALCQRCHLKIDAHVRHAGRKKKSQ